MTSHLAYAFYTTPMQLGKQEWPLRGLSIIVRCVFPHLSDCIISFYGGKFYTFPLQSVREEISAKITFLHLKRPAPWKKNPSYAPDYRPFIVREEPL